VTVPGAGAAGAAGARLVAGSVDEVQLERHGARFAVVARVSRAGMQGAASGRAQSAPELTAQHAGPALCLCWGECAHMCVCLYLCVCVYVCVCVFVCVSAYVVMCIFFNTVYVCTRVCITCVTVVQHIYKLRF